MKTSKQIEQEKRNEQAAWDCDTLGYQRECEHVDFDEDQNGNMECRDCGLEAQTCMDCGEPVREPDSTYWHKESCERYGRTA